MYISPNLIRFPAPAFAPARPADVRESANDNVVAFPAAAKTDDLSAWSGGSAQLQEYGQIFAAHRIVSRIADQLDAVAAL